MENVWFAWSLLVALPLVAAGNEWPPATIPAIQGTAVADLTINGRPAEIFQHGVKPEWGYQAPQQDTFIVVHPRPERKNAPLYVVLHSAGHDVVSCLLCTRDVGNHDIYRSPDDFYALYFYWGPFGHANNHAAIEKVNDLINSFDWLRVSRNAAYPVFAQASSNDKIPWPDAGNGKAVGQINAFFRWKNISDTRNKIELALFLATPAVLKTTFDIPAAATADVSLRRIQQMQLKPGATCHWTFGAATGQGQADTEGLVTIPGLKITAQPTTLTVSK